jgi:hypothetical protein
MTNIVFGLELLVKKIEYLKIQTFPSLTLVLDTNPPLTLIPYSEEAKTGDVWRPNQIYQFMYVVDAFEKCVSCPISFELVSPFESTALGKCTYELKPLICDAIAAHGSSPVVCQTSTLRDFERHEVALMSFELRVIFFKMCRKRAAIERFHVKEIPRTEIARLLGDMPVQAGQFKIAESPERAPSDLGSPRLTA